MDGFRQRLPQYQDQRQYSAVVTNKKKQRPVPLQPLRQASASRANARSRERPAEGAENSAPQRYGRDSESKQHKPTTSALTIDILDYYMDADPSQGRMVTETLGSNPLSSFDFGLAAVSHESSIPSIPPPPSSTHVLPPASRPRARSTASTYSLFPTDAAPPQPALTGPDRYAVTDDTPLPSPALPLSPTSTTAPRRPTCAATRTISSSSSSSASPSTLRPSWSSARSACSTDNATRPLLSPPRTASDDTQPARKPPPLQQQPRSISSPSTPSTFPLTRPQRPPLLRSGTPGAPDSTRSIFESDDSDDEAPARGAKTSLLRLGGAGWGRQLSWTKAGVREISQEIKECEGGGGDEGAGKRVPRFDDGGAGRWFGGCCSGRGRRRR